MTSKMTLSIICICGTLTGVALSGISFFHELYLPALISLSIGVISTELRVRLGFRGVRAGLFISHLVLSFGYLGLLTALLVGYRAPLLTPLTWFAYTGMIISGIMLIQRSWHPRVPAPKP